MLFILYYLWFLFYHEVVVLTVFICPGTYASKRRKVCFLSLSPLLSLPFSSFLFLYLLLSFHSFLILLTCSLCDVRAGVVYVAQFYDSMSLCFLSQTQKQTISFDWNDEMWINNCVDFKTDDWGGCQAESWWCRWRLEGIFCCVTQSFSFSLFSLTSQGWCWSSCSVFFMWYVSSRSLVRVCLLHILLFFLLLSAISSFGLLPQYRKGWHQESFINFVSLDYQPKFWCCWTWCECWHITNTYD